MGVVRMYIHIYWPTASFEGEIRQDERRKELRSYSTGGTGAPAPISSLERISLPVLAIFSVTVSNGGSEGPYTTTRWVGRETV